MEGEARGNTVLWGWERGRGGVNGRWKAPGSSVPANVGDRVMTVHYYRLPN